MKNENISIVLVRPKHSGNVGSVARAMKVTGFRKLALVSPCEYLNPEARWMAHASEDVLERAKKFRSIGSALRGKHIVVGTTHRKRHIHSPMLYLREAAGEIVRASGNNRIAVLFGPEDSGLLNEELALCDYIITIPQIEQYPSLNLAQSVMLTCYELMLAGETELPPLSQLSSKAELKRMYEHLERTIHGLGYTGLLPEKIMTHFRRILGRTTLTKSESNMVRGICTQIEKIIRECSNIS